MYLTGMVEKRTLEKYEREAKEKNRETWYLSWALDTNLEGKKLLVHTAFTYRWFGLEIGTRKVHLLKRQERI